MTYKIQIARQAALTEALQIINEAIGDNIPHRQSLRIIAAIKSARDKQPLRVPGAHMVDYLEQLQIEARRAWRNRWADSTTGHAHDAEASIMTPVGRLSATIWRREWRSGGVHQRTAWAAEYSLSGQPITIREIRAAGLAQRPSTRNRKR